MIAIKNRFLRGKIMILEPKCGYFNEERNDEYAPPYGECEDGMEPIRQMNTMLLIILKKYLSL